MIIKYGDGSALCVLNVTRLNSFTAEAVYNGPDKLYDRIRIDVTAVFNPGTQHDSLVGTPLTYLQNPPHVEPPVPVTRRQRGPLVGQFIAPHGRDVRPDRPAIYTAEAVRATLMQPRLRLHAYLDHQSFLISPLPGLKTDETDGPKPLSCEVVEMHSGKTFLVRWVCQTDLNTCPEFSQWPHAVLSNQWGQSHDLDERFLTTITSRGKTVFSAAALNTNGVANLGNTPLKADDLRHQIVLPPIPADFKRERIHTSVEPDGLTINWEVVDRELPIRWDKAGIVSVEGFHATETSNPMTLSSLNSLTFNDYLSFKFTIEATRLIFGQLLSKKSLEDFNENLKLILGTVSVGFSTIFVRAVGHRGVSRNVIENFIRDIIEERWKRTKVIPGAIPVKSETKHDIVSNAVQGLEIVSHGPLKSVNALKKSLPTGNQNQQSVFGDINETAGFLTDRTPAQSGIGQPQSPPGDGGYRGTFLEILMHSVLSEPCNWKPTDVSARERLPNLLLPSAAPPLWPKPAK